MISNMYLQDRPYIYVDVHTQMNGIKEQGHLEFV